MKRTVLIDNNTLIDRYFLEEPGLSYLIREGNKQILFDVGYSNAFILNSQKLNLNLRQSDFIILSHGYSLLIEQIETLDTISTDDITITFIHELKKNFGA